MIALQQRFINTPQMSYHLPFEMFMTPRKCLALWGLFLEQESYLPCIYLDYKNLSYKIYTTILKNCMQKILW